MVDNKYPTYHLNLLHTFPFTSTQKGNFDKKGILLPWKFYKADCPNLSKISRDLCGTECCAVSLENSIRIYLKGP